MSSKGAILRIKQSKQSITSIPKDARLNHRRRINTGEAAKVKLNVKFLENDQDFQDEALTVYHVSIAWVSCGYHVSITL